MTLCNPTLDPDYAKKYTRNGFICYYFKDRKIAKSKIPINILNSFPTDREIVFIEILKRTKIFTGFTFLSSQGRKIYMFNGCRIPKRIITDQEFEKMRNIRTQWEKTYSAFRKGYSKKENVPSGPSKEKTKETPEPEKEINPHLNPYELLQKYKINNKKDWKLWMLKNHPDKNPNTNIELVKLINMAVSVIFG